MASVEQVGPELSVLVGVLGLVSLLVLYVALGHTPWIWERWAAWWLGLWGAPVTLPACPYPQCGTWIPW